MATIKAIEAKSVHQIQSGQVIVDLCSVVKELVENSLDAGASSIEVNFKNNGLDLIEVRDNGFGISPSNYGSVALKHFTSKLSSYDDLSSLETFGFRGEALSSLCALSNFSIVTAQADEVPKGSRLEFETSGALKDTSTVAAQRGTTASVENLFAKLPVRQKELSKNIKREYGKVLGLLHAYACIGVNVKFTVKNAMPKAKGMAVFSTRGNSTTRDNIANVYGAKTLSALVPLDLDLDFQRTLTQMSRDDAHITKVAVQGHISRPVWGEGRQTPDRQLFFVNGRPCGLPQIAKAINEVYRSFNSSQSPFILANFRMDTNAYDVNVSPDKRTILLHNAVNLIERLKTRLTEMFDKQEQTVPQSQVHMSKLPAFKQLSVQRQASTDTALSEDSQDSSTERHPRLTTEGNHLDDDAAEDVGTNKVLQNHFRNQASTREENDEHLREKSEAKLQKAREKQAEKIAKAVARQEELSKSVDEYDDVRELGGQEKGDGMEAESPHAIRVRDFNARMAEHQQPQRAEKENEAIESIPTGDIPVVEKNGSGIMQNAFDRMRPKKSQAQIATVTIDDESTTQVIGTQYPSFGNQAGKQAKGSQVSTNGKESAVSKFSQSLRKFGGPGTQIVTDMNEQVSEDDLPGEISDSRKRSTPALAEAAPQENDAEDQSVEDENKAESGNDHSPSDDSDRDYVDEAEKKAEEEARVAELIRAAEESASMPSKENLRRANKALKGGQTRDSTTSLLATLDTSLEQLRTQMEALREAMKEAAQSIPTNDDDDPSAKDEETRLSLTVSKDDFANMEIVGQFNLGFILAMRRAAPSEHGATLHNKDELFIIDQHASDEKFNFERLQAETVVGNQRMVQPVTLSLTAVEEEIVLENTAALEKNGFVVDVDTTGTSPVGRRVTLTSLPLSKEVTFDTRDLDELIHLLSESPMLNDDSPVPRPGRVRKMFAMRACRSSVMIGKTLSMKQMERVVRNMGTIEKPWNCPHGRPTMRHLTSLDALPSWAEGGGVAIGDDGEYGYGTDSERIGRLWREYLTD